MITINNIRKIYNLKPVVDIEYLEINDSEIIGLVGNNGAGKTTLFRLMLDLVRAESGSINSFGKDVAKSENWKNYTSAYLEEGFLINHLTPKEYFYFCGSLHQISVKEVDSYLEQFSSFLEEDIFKSRKYIRDLSKGNQFKVGIVSCILQQPKVLILDEPFACLDPTSQIRLKEILKKIYLEKGLTIIISSHDLNHVTSICSRILLMEKGQIIKDLKTESSTLKDLEKYFNV